MEAVGDACEQQGQLETARELYLAAPNPCAALRIMNRQLSDLIKPAMLANEAAGMLPVYATLACSTYAYTRGKSIISTLFVALVTRTTCAVQSWLSLTGQHSRVPFMQHSYIHTYIQTYIHTHTHTLVHTFVHQSSSRAVNT